MSIPDPAVPNLVAVHFLPTLVENAQLPFQLEPPPALLHLPPAGLRAEPGPSPQVLERAYKADATEMLVPKLEVSAGIPGATTGPRRRRRNSHISVYMEALGTHLDGATTYSELV